MMNNLRSPLQFWMPVVGITCLFAGWQILASPQPGSARSKDITAHLLNQNPGMQNPASPQGSIAFQLKQTLDPDGSLNDEHEHGDENGGDGSNRPPKVPTIPPRPPLGNTAILLEVEGVLEAGDQVLPSDNSLYDEHAFEGRAGQPIIITLESDDFDTYLVLVSPDQRLLSESDDVSDDNSNSSVTTILPSDGTYRAIANAFDSTGQGDYTLTIREIVGSPRSQGEHIGSR